MLELMVGTVEAITLSVTVAFTSEDCVLEALAVTVSVDSKTTELVFSDIDDVNGTDVAFTAWVKVETPSVELTLTETVDEMLSCGVGTKVG